MILRVLCSNIIQPPGSWEDPGGPTALDVIQTGGSPCQEDSETAAVMGLKELCTFFMSVLIVLLERRGDSFPAGKHRSGMGMHGAPGALAALQGLALEPGGTQAGIHLTEKPQKNRESTGMCKQRHKEFTELKYHLKNHFCHLNPTQQ